MSSFILLNCVRKESQFLGLPSNFANFISGSFCLIISNETTGDEDEKTSAVFELSFDFIFVYLTLKCDNFL